MIANCRRDAQEPGSSFSLSRFASPSRPYGLSFAKQSSGNPEPSWRAESGKKVVCPRELWIPVTQRPSPLGVGGKIRGHQNLPTTRLIASRSDKRTGPIVTTPLAESKLPRKSEPYIGCNTKSYIFFFSFAFDHSFKSTSRYAHSRLKTQST